MAFVADQEGSSSSMPRYPYRVFLSFRGVDTRLTFTGHLYTALVNAGINTFKDDIEITRGEKIKSELEKGIQQSSASLIVFSKDYASSRWCLDELAMIVERRSVSRHFVLPIFYHVDPTDVRRQTGSIGEAFVKYEEKLQRETNTEKNNRLVEDIKRWRAALNEAADISGMELKIEANGDESQFIQKVVDVVQSSLSPKFLDVDPDLVGMPLRTQDICLWIQDATTHASVMLICGMGGVGKTTIAKQVYNENYRDFEVSCFLSEIRERSKDYKGVIDLQKQLLSSICNRKHEKINNVDEGIYKIKDAICFKKVLLVLDDVDHIDQIKAIFRMQDSLYPGSKIMVTTRNVQLKHAYQHCKVHEVRTLSTYESIKLFSLHSFRQVYPIESYMEHVQKIVSHCEGLPLALQILGSSLYEKKIDIWESLLKKLDENPHCQIVEKLMISFDCLQDDDVKNVFLHIACLFAGEDKDCTVKILDACDMSAVHGIDHLVDLCLLKIDYGDKLRMHQLIKDMGRYIVHKESTNDPGRRRVLWRPQDCFDVLQEKTGTRAVEALAFDMQMYRENNLAESIICGTNSKKRKFEEQQSSNFLSWNFRDDNIRNSNEMDLDTAAFARMRRLMFLKLNSVELSGCCTDFPKGLRWLSWHRCHFKCMPSDSSLRNLVCLEMQYCSLKQLWKGSKFLPALKILDLSHSWNLASSLDFSGMPNLEILILEGCTQLVEVCESIKSAKGLVLLNLKDCRRLRKLPRNISALLLLKELIISGCSSLDEFPMGLRNLKSLKRFRANRINKSAFLSPAKGILSWACLPQFIETLSLENCQLSNDCFPKDLSNLSLLKELYLGGNMITSLPDCCGTLSNLDYLDMTGCRLLQSVVGLPLTLKRHLSEGYMDSYIKFIHSWESERFISCKDCPELAEIEGCYKRVLMRDVERGVIKQLGLMDSEPSLKELDVFNDVEVAYGYGVLTTLVPLDKLPGCFISYEETSDVIYNLLVPDNPNNIQGLTLAFVYLKRKYYNELEINIVNETKNKNLDYRFNVQSTVGTRDKRVLWLGHIKLGTTLLQPGDHLTFQIRIRIGGRSCIGGRRDDGDDDDVFKCYWQEFGVMLVYKDEEEDCDITQQHNITPYPFTKQYCRFSGNSMSVYGFGQN